MERYFSIHSLSALNNKQFSVVMANIDNTPDKVKLAQELYPEPDFYIEFHNTKINLSIN